MSPSVLDKEEAFKLLKANGTEDNVIQHCIAVSELAVEISKRLILAGHKLDIGFVESAALLHDIGRSKTHDIRHGIEGAHILRKYPRYARVCECHIGAGITRLEATALGLAPRDYLPETLEERVVCYADKLVQGTKRTTLKETLEKFRRRLGADHPTIGRIRDLDAQINALMGSDFAKH
jgi:uncharacterized protein